MEQRKTWTRRLILSSLAALFAILLPASCTSSRTSLQSAIEPYGGVTITVAGLETAEFTVTPSELAELTCVKRGSYTGVLLTEFLAKYGAKPEDFKLARFFASDAYRVTLHAQTLTDSEVLLVLTPLAESERPLRLYVPDLESNQWIYAIERIEFEHVEAED